jgi:hypothetical protein
MYNMAQKRSLAEGLLFLTWDTSIPLVETLFNVVDRRGSAITHILDE